MSKPYTPGADPAFTEVLDAWPQTIRVFLSRVMDGIACTVSVFDTIDAGLPNRGRTLDRFMAEQTRAAREEPPNP